MLVAVTCLFNHLRAPVMLENYRRFRRNLNADLITIELSDGPPFVIDDAIQVRGGPAHLMWQKERLLNLAMEGLPSSCDKVAWIDADLLFLNPRWRQEAETLLDDFPMIQLFDRMAHVDGSGSVRLGLKGTVSARREGGSQQGKGTSLPGVGYGWAGRREWIDELGLFDAGILGGGDALMFRAAMGWLDDPLIDRELPPGMVEVWKNWATSCHDRVRGRIGNVRGDIIHLYHGLLTSRKYGERDRWLRESRFDPATDIALDPNGLWRWNSEKPQLHEQVRRYFRDRLNAALGSDPQSSDQASISPSPK